MIRALASIGAIQVLIMLVALVRAKMLSTSLGPAGFGVMSTIDQVVLTILQVSTLSLPFTAMRLMAKGHSQGDTAFKEAFSTFLKLLAGLGIGTTMVCSALLAWRPGVFGGDLLPYRDYLVLAVLSLPALILQIMFVNALAAAQAPAASAFLSLIVSLLLAVAAVAGTLTAGIWGLYVATLVTGVVTTVAALIYLRRRFGLGVLPRSLPLAQTLKQNPDIVTHSLLLWVALTAYAVTLFATRYMVLSSLGETHAGLLQALISLSVTVGAVVAPMSALYLAPLVNRDSATHEKTAAADAFASKVALLLLAGAVPLVLFPRFTMGLLFSSDFAPAAQWLFVFIIWQCLYQITNVYLQLLIGLGDTPYFSVITCLAYLVAVSLFPALIPMFGIVGVGVALVTSMLVAAAGASARLRHKFGSSITAAVWWRVGYLVTVVAFGGVLFSVSTEATASGIVGRSVYGAVTLVLAWLALTTDERGMARRLLRRA